MEYKRMNDINTLATSVDNETYIIGTDEFGDELTIVFNTIDLLHWIDMDTIEYMKKQSQKYIINL